MKTINIQQNIGKAKYVVSWHDGHKKHKDGSDFYDIAIFKNKIALNKFVTALRALLLAAILISSYTTNAQQTRDEEKSNYVVAGFHAGYNLKHPIAGLQIGYRFHNFYLSANDYIPVSSDATAPQIFGGSLGYNIGSFQPFISYAYHTIGREKDAYFGYSNRWHNGVGLSYYPLSFPIAFTVQRTGKVNIANVTLYKAL